MKTKIIILQSIAIGLLLVLLISHYISFSKKEVITREELSVDEATIAYSPPSPKFALSDISSLVKGLKENFTPTIDQITDEIFLARGYMLGSIGMVKTSAGLVLVDAGENKEIAGDILRELKEIADLPVQYILLTHGHLDHVLGLPALVEDDTKIIASAEAELVMEKDLQWLKPYHQWARSTQFGDVSDEYSLKRFIDLPFNPDKEWEVIMPAQTFSDHYKFEFGGKTFELFLGPGETEGQIFIWIPEDKALFCGDQYYESFPNLSSPMLEARPVDRWIASLQMMAELEPEYLIPSHTKPVLGKDNVKKVLQDRIRGITFVYDAAIAAINNGLNVEEAIASITFPKDLAELPQFKESYGTLVWSIRGIYQRETGWYDGRGSGLNPLPEKVKAQEIVQLAGGVDKILSRAIELQKAGDHQLACELCDIVIAANADEKLARIIKSFSLDYMSLSSNGNMMGFYRSAASLERKKAGYKIE